MTEENLEIDVSTQDEPELLAITSTTQDESDSELLAITSTNDEGEIIVGENETKLDKTTNCENSVVEDIPTDDDNKNRKRKHEEDEENDEKQEQETQIAADTTSDNIDDEPKTKKAALDRLRNMKFSVKDPFKDNPPKERPTFIRSTKHSSRKSSIDEESTTKTSSSRRNSRSRLDDDSSYRSRRRHRSRSRNGNNERHRGEENSSSMDKLIESRHQRSTMYFLQKDKSKYGISSSPQKQQQQINNRSSNIPIKPIQERIDALLARPDYEVLAMPVADLRALILQGVELFREQNNFLSAKKTLLSELESLIYAEREEIERLSQEVQTSYRPPPEELVVQKQQQLPEQQKVLDFSIPPPNIMTSTTTNVVSGIDGGISSTSNICGGINNNNEFSTPPPNFSQPPPQQQPILSSSSTLQFNNNINSQPTTILSSSSTSSQQSLILGGGGSSPFSHFSQTPSLLYPSTPSKLIQQQQQLNICVSNSNVVDVSSKITELIKTSISLPNTSFPPPKLLLETSRPHSNPNFSVNRLVTTTSTTTNQQLPPLPPLSSSFFSVPPPQIFINKQSEQQQQTVVTSSIIPSLLSLPPPQMITNASQSVVFSCATSNSPLKQLEQQKQLPIVTSSTTNIPSLLSLPTPQLMITYGNVSSSTATPPLQQNQQ